MQPINKRYARFIKGTNTVLLSINGLNIITEAKREDPLFKTYTILNEIETDNPFSAEDDMIKEIKQIETDRKREMKKMENYLIDLLQSEINKQGKTFLD